jgi:FKBP-type peptidyl-prolyl cis-trans isomerase 2
MRTAKRGDRVQVHFSGRTDAGELFMDSERDGPLEFIIGDETFFADLGGAIIGMHPGESKALRLLPERAFGSHRPELVRRLARNVFRTDQELALGSKLIFQSGKTHTEFRVTAVEPNAVTMDANHPLAGQSVNFELKLTAIF